MSDEEKKEHEEGHGKEDPEDDFAFDPDENEDDEYDDEEDDPFARGLPTKLDDGSRLQIKMFDRYDRKDPANPKLVYTAKLERKINRWLKERKPHPKTGVEWQPCKSVFGPYQIGSAISFMYYEELS